VEHGNKKGYIQHFWFKITNIPPFAIQKSRMSPFLSPALSILYFSVKYEGFGIGEPRFHWERIPCLTHRPPRKQWQKSVGSP
jgi:hypothetical protein